MVFIVPAESRGPRPGDIEAEAERVAAKMKEIAKTYRDISRRHGRLSCR